jgi:hypothetical protein
MPRVALPDSCRHAVYLGVSTLHTFKINITWPSFIVGNLFMRRTFQNPTGNPRILDIVDLRPLQVMMPASILRDYSTSASSMPSCFPRRIDLLGNLFPTTSLLDLLFFYSFLDHHTGHFARHDARILLMSASSMPSDFFHRRFDLLEVCFL